MITSEHEPRAFTPDGEAGARSPVFARGDIEKSFRQMLDALPTAIYTTDAHGKLTYFNPACVEFSGRTPDIGSDSWCVTWKLYHADGRPMPHDQCPMAIALKEGRVVHGTEAIAERPDGTRIWFTPYPTPLFDDAGNIIGGINMLVDITELKQGEQAERIAQTQLEAELADSKLLQALSAEMTHEGAEGTGALYGKLLDAAVAIMRSDFASMQMLYPERGASGELHLLASRGFSPEAAKFWEWVRADSNCSCGVALKTRQRTIATDVANCDFMAGTEDQSTYLKAGIRAVQSTPLISRDGTLVGMISTHWSEPHEPAERDLRLMDIVARQAADLIERRRAEEALHKSERELSDFFDSASIGLHWVGPDGIILRVNQAELDMLGYSRKEYVGHHIAEFHVDLPVIEDMLARLARGETLREHPARLRCKDGSIRDVLINSSALFENGQFVHSRCFSHDVTERKGAEESRFRLAAIVESSDDAIVSKGLDGIIRSWNAGAERVFGYTAAEAIGQPITLLIPPDRLQEEPKIIERLKRGERVDHFETQRVRKDGSRLDVSLTISPVKDASGRVIGASKIARDITDRKQVEQALRDSEERFRMLADNISQLAWTCDQLGNCTWYNQRWFDYTGKTYEDMHGWGWKQVHHPDHVERVVEGVERARIAGELWEDTFPLRGKDGKYRWFLSRAYPIRDAQGHIIRWFGTNTDVTEQRELNEALRDADRRKDEFIATLAHELRNPLAPLRNGLQVMKLMKDDAQRVEEVRSIMERQVEQMVHLIDDLMDVSRITRGKVQLRLARIHLNQPIEAAIETSRPLIEECGHNLTVNLPTHQIFVDVDATRLAQIISNLLNNAAKYTNRGGSITLSVERQADDAVITVRDSGIGIPANMLDRVFEPFAQVDRSLEKSQGGLGIGLSLVRGLVEMHDGTVEARSDGPGKGSEFVIRLPAAAPPEEQELGASGNGHAVPLANRCVLIVDDNRDAANSLAMMLRLSGHNAQTAHDGLEAVKIVAETRPDVVLLDIGMPKLNGYDTARSIREQPWGKNIKLIALTGWGHEQDRQNSSDAGFDHHLVKPVDQSALLNLLG